MKKSAFAMFAFSIAVSANANINVGLYPFYDVCRGDIETYCTSADALGDCMMGNYSLLNDECSAAVYYWAGRHHNWQEDWLSVPVQHRYEMIRDMRNNQ